MSHRIPCPARRERSELFERLRRAPMKMKRSEVGLSRRRLLRSIAAAAVIADLPNEGLPYNAQAKNPKRLPICIFSKYMQFLDVTQMAAAAAEIGFDGIDLAVRSGGSYLSGHVLPERVEEDLPKAAEIIRKVGLVLPMITAGIVDTHSPHAESILRTISRLGIPRYRWGWFGYVDSMSIPDRLAELKKRVAELAEMNKRYKVCAMYHTHSGLQVGASIWDLWVLLKDFDPQWVSVDFDIAHATIEGGLGGWIHSTRLTAPLMRGIAIKDFKWGKNQKGQWEPQWCPLGEGMVNFKRYFVMLKEAKFVGPVQLHFEYPLGGAEDGARTVKVEKRKIFAAMHKDLSTLRGWLREAELN